MVIPTDPTLLFANAGMNQFKEIFLGARESKNTRVTNTQKCIRVSGKHNDLEEVGVDTYHHTFFEMMGNWSFGDYYKKEAISWAWELLTEVWKLPKDRLWVSVYKEDDEAEQLWKTLTDVKPDHVLRFDEKDNFWEMGETGPCGPCSEIHIDLTEQGCTADMVNADSPEVIEVWNLVFIQYNRRADGSLEELPSKHVDTGMGFERIVTVLQGKKSNYDTDVFMPLIEKVQELSGKAYEGDGAIAMRVIADHVRTLSIAISDGVIPSNEGRGYVLRRLLRRAVRYGRNLGLQQPFLGELVPVVLSALGDVFPELVARKEDILRSLKSEEESFFRTLGRGLSLFEEISSSPRTSQTGEVSGDDAFKLYDTHGFPLDLTQLMASEQGVQVDEDRFSVLMEEQRARARGARDNEELKKEMDLIANLVNQGIRSQFTGYENDSGETAILTLLSNGQTVEKLQEGDAAEIILKETPFYSESGGQVGDRGTIQGPTGIFEVDDTQRPAEGLVLHVGRLVRGSLQVSDSVTVQIDTARRSDIRKHHTATHLLNAALRELVNPNTKQAGSQVQPNRLRFDFSHHEAIPADQLEAMERRVNQWVMEDSSVNTFEMDYTDVAGSGIVAVFDEKYGDRVRVVDIGGFSKELCGGTHVASTGEIGFFRIVTEGSISSGVRRIEAVCGLPAYEWTREEHVQLHQLAQRFSVQPDEVFDRVEQLLAKNKKFEKEIKRLNSAAALGQVDALLDQKQEINGMTLITAVVEDQSGDALREIMEALNAKIDSGVILLGSAHDGKASFVASATKDLVGRGVHAGKLIGQVAKIAGGGGGGQPHKAQAGGKDPSMLSEAIAQVPELLHGQI